MALLVFRGFTVADLDRFTLGMLINYCRAYDRMQARAHGVELPDEDARLRQLKAIEPIIEEQYAHGEISEEEYRCFRAAIAECE